VVLISWNIDSLNAALTGGSPRALLSRTVLESLKDHDPEAIALQETKLPCDGPTEKHLEVLKYMFAGHEIVWNCSVKPASEGYAGTLYLNQSEKPTIRKDHNPRVYRKSIKIY
jgi:exodeoxyribonuclease-3